MIKIEESKKVNLTIYKSNELKEYLNQNNILSFEKIKEIEDMIKFGYFKVPSVIINQSWGVEKVFLPFSNKLFKVITTNLGNTSIQLHPLKGEKYISLSDSTVLYDGEKEINLKKYKYVDIIKNTIHSMNKGSKVFEEQDNVIFDKNETIRIFDSLGRNVNTPYEYYKYLLPQFKNKMIFSDIPNNDYSEDTDKFIFIIDGSIDIQFNDKLINLNGNEDLFFIRNDIKIEKIIGNYKIIDCIYYKVENEK